jgi:hypothetical protein
LSVVLIPFTISRVISGCDTSSTAITPTWTISPVSTHPVLTATAFSLMERTIRPTETRLRPEKAHSCQDNVDSLVFDEGMLHCHDGDSPARVANEHVGTCLQVPPTQNLPRR